VTEPLLHDRQWHAGGDKPRGVGVAQVVKSRRLAQPFVLRILDGTLPSALLPVALVESATARGTEDQIIGFPDRRWLAVVPQPPLARA
jgi:hypothetical protein